MSMTLKSHTLNLVDRLLDLGRNLQVHGQHTKAAGLLARLARFRELPRDVAEEAHVRLAEIELERNQPKQARRHLVTALAYQPDCAHYHYLLAVAAEEDPNGNPQQAALHYRRCLELDPEHPDYWCEYAHFALGQKQTRSALAAWRRAADLAADDPDTLGQVAAGLRRANKQDEAKQLLRAALFRHPHDRRFRGLWDKHQFDLLHAAQQPAPREPRRQESSEPMILPLVRPKKRTQKAGAKIIRTDGPGKLKGPTILPFRVARKKDA